MSDLVLYTNPMSRGRIARWILEEAGVPYRTEIVEYGQPMKSGPYAAINPMGKVPALRHGDMIVTEAAAICAYVADAFPEAGLSPPLGSPLRGPYFRWMFFASGPMEQAVTAKAMGWQVPADKAGFNGYGDGIGRVLDSIESALGDEYILGKTFSAADVYVASHLSYSLRFKMIEPRPKFVAYVERLLARPAKQRADAIDNALMPPPAEAKA